MLVTFKSTIDFILLLILCPYDSNHLVVRKIDFQKNLLSVNISSIRGEKCVLDFAMKNIFDR